MVIFDLFNEPILVANDRMGNGPCRNRGAAGATAATSQGYRSAGMQQMLDAVRATGATAAGRRRRHRLGAQARRLAGAQAERSDRQPAGRLPRLPAAADGLRHHGLLGARGDAGRGAGAGAGRARWASRTARTASSTSSWRGPTARGCRTWAGRGTRRTATLPGAGHRLQRHADQLRRRPARPPDPDQPVVRSVETRPAPCGRPRLGFCV